MSELFLKIENISKAFPGVQALSEVSIDVKKGTIHALLGENGAGKSTLIKIISGIYKTDEGTITLEGNEVTVNNPREAQELGISVVHQELNLVGTLTVAENIFLGKLHKRGAFTDWNTVFSEAGKLINELGVSLAPQDIVKTLTIAQQQVVEICKAMTYNSKLFILDEPTATLTVNEIEKLFDIMRKIKADGGTIIYISHRLEEVFEVCDELTVLRDGRAIGTKVVAETNKAELIRMMVGRELHEEYPYAEKSIGDTVLEIKGLVREGKTDETNFFLRQGEILGFSGLVGSGRTELMRTVLGIDRCSAGEVILHGRKVRYKNFSEAIRDQFGFITEDRKRQGLILGMSVERNITLASLKSVSKFGFILFNKESEAANTYIDKLRVMTPSEKTAVKHLSGGNQQKVVLAKWLFVDADIIIVDEPTRGIDVGAKVEIYKLMNDLVAEGKSVIMVSSDMPELIGMCDRIYVMHEGRIKGELDRKDFSSERILDIAFS